jgi:hypothetical protein
MLTTGNVSFVPRFLALVGMKSSLSDTAMSVSLQSTVFLLLVGESRLLREQLPISTEIAP